MALRRGAISYSKTRAITRVATPAKEATLLEMAQHATASQLERICRGYRRVVIDQARERPESLAGWDGTPVDYGLAVQALLASEAAGGSPPR